MNAITPSEIKDLLPGQVFVFGANLAGRHGRGGAKTALGWGAKYGQASGLQGRTYGIPTKDASVVRSLTIDEIRPHVDRFIEFAKSRKDLTFLVTEIGCGLAGHNPRHIGMLFQAALGVENIHLPERFLDELTNTLDTIKYTETTPDSYIGSDKNKTDESFY